MKKMLFLLVPFLFLLLVNTGYSQGQDSYVRITVTTYTIFNVTSHITTPGAILTFPAQTTYAGNTNTTPADNTTTWDYRSNVATHNITATVTSVAGNVIPVSLVNNITLTGQYGPAAPTGTATYAAPGIVTLTNASGMLSGVGPMISFTTIGTASGTINYIATSNGDPTVGDYDLKITYTVN
jgi:hypothetical protein